MRVAKYRPGWPPSSTSVSVLYVGDDRTTKALDGFYAGLSREDRKAIYAVAMDMWEPYVTSTGRDATRVASLGFQRIHREASSSG